MSNEWYTPSKYIEAAREVMGSIDLDPASCALANQTVRAARYYTQEDDGLSKAWYGNVWLNPPYSKPLPWVKRSITSHALGEIDQVILCLNVDSSTTWFHLLLDYPICLHKGRVRFEQDRTRLFHVPSMRPTGFIYIGNNEQRFIDVFSQFGRIAKAVDVPVAKPRQLELVS